MKFLAAAVAALPVTAVLAAPTLSFSPSNPTPADTIEVYVTETAANCPFIRIQGIGQSSGRIVIPLSYIGDCGFGPFSQTYATLGRLPAGIYQVVLIRETDFNEVPPPIQDARELVVAHAVGQSAPSENYAGLYTTNIPGEGVSVEQVGTTAFIALFTYDANGAPTWIYMPAAQWSFDSRGVYRFAGPVHSTQRSAPPSAAGSVAETVVGQGTFSAARDSGDLQMTVNGTLVTRTLRRFRL